MVMASHEHPLRIFIILQDARYSPRERIFLLEGEEQRTYPRNPGSHYSYATEDSPPWDPDTGPTRFPLWIHRPGAPKPSDVPPESPLFLTQCLEHA